MADVALQSRASTKGAIDLATEVQPPDSLNAIANVALVAGQLVSLTAAGKWQLSDADADAVGIAVYMVTKSCRAGMPALGIRQALVDGFVLDGIAYGAPVYNSATAGAIADAAPVSNGRVIGRVVPANGQALGANPDKLLSLAIP